MAKHFMNIKRQRNKNQNNKNCALRYNILVDKQAQIPVYKSNELILNKNQTFLKILYEPNENVIHV